MIVNLVPQETPLRKFSVSWKVSGRRARAAAAKFIGGWRVSVAEQRKGKMHEWVTPND